MRNFWRLKQGEIRKAKALEPELKFGGDCGES